MTRVEPAAPETQPVVEARNETLRRIGRNVVLFQDLERILKFIAAAQHPSMPLSKAKEMRDERADSIRTQTLGQVAGDVVRTLYADSDSESAVPAEITEPWLALSFRIGTDSTSIEESRKKLKSLVDERNDLVHHVLPRWNLHDIDSCSALSAELDEQRLRIIREIDRYRRYANAVTEMARELQAFIDSDDGRRQLDLAFLQQSRLAALLASVTAERARADGWTLLSVAGAQLNNLIPEELARLKAEHGKGSLQKLVAAIDLFEMRTEDMPNGGTRAIYRKRT
jgi:hypothetical protein